MKIVKQIIASSILFILIVCCKGKYRENNASKYDSLPTKPAKNINKPGASFSDSIYIKEAAAIFYYPDSLQDVRIKAITEPAIYNSSTHEMFYQMRNAKIVIKKTYPKLKVIEVTNSRFLMIQKKDGGKQIIDLDKYNDARGLILCNGIKEPQLADMTNIETELYRYFNDGQ